MEMIAVVRGDLPAIRFKDDWQILSDVSDLRMNREMKAETQNGGNKRPDPETKHYAISREALRPRISTPERRRRPNAPSSGNSHPCKPYVTIAKAAAIISKIIRQYRANFPH
jgi:hypothetical protein